MSIDSSASAATPASPKRNRTALLFDLLFLLVLVLGAYFRFVGLYWGEYQYLHPDERFLVWVGTDISPIVGTDSSGGKDWMNLSEYFDTPNSSLNPQNRGHGFYVYGTLPMFLTRYLVEWVFGHSGFDEMTQMGRALSAFADLLVVMLIYLVAEKLYDRRVAILAAAFSAAAVLQIQQSHFFTMDTFINFFSFLAFYFAVRVLLEPRLWPEEKVALPLAEGEDSEEAAASGSLSDRYFSKRLLFLSLAFGVALGMAVASKLNAAPMAFALPAALLLRLFKLPSEERDRRLTTALLYLGLAAITSLIVFRIFQPYAFSGPGFFGLKFNPEWLANMRELRAQSGSREVDYPPAMQWARRPIWFSVQNIVLWGLGLPLGLLAWTGFLWIGWRILKGEWFQHGLIWGWTAFYFAWQSLALNPTMRYQLPIYPSLAIFAAWALVRLADLRLPNHQPRRWAKPVAVLLGLSVLVLTYAWAFAFSQVYARPITRVAASRWIYQNIPGPLNVRIQTTDGVFNQPVPFPYGFTITPGIPFQSGFSAHATGLLSEIYLPHVADQAEDHQTRTLALTVSASPDMANPLGNATFTGDLTPSQDPRGGDLNFRFDAPIRLEKDLPYYLELKLVSDDPIPPVVEAPVTLYFQTPEGAAVTQPLETPINLIASNSIEFTAYTEGILTAFEIRGASTLPEGNRPQSATLTLETPGEALEAMQIELLPQNVAGGTPDLYALSQPLPVIPGDVYTLSIETANLGGKIALQAAAIANEGEWDDGLPLRMDGYDGYGGIYPLDLNFNMYWEDTPEKLDRFVNVMQASDYLAISSNRQWGSLPRLPERFPMTTVYYRNLLGCPPEQNLHWCYSVARPGQFQGALGYELVQVFQSDPAIGPIRINDQFAEEAFTVYDHPKVFIFKKSASFNPETVRSILGTVDFSQIIRIPPLKFGPQPANLLLPEDRLSEQRQGGTWAKLFNPASLLNRSPGVAAVVWYLLVALLGLLTYPILRLAFPGLPDRGYPLARTAGLLLLSYFAWLAGSFRIPYERPTITVVILGLALIGGTAAFFQRKEITQELRSKSRYLVIVEILALGLFLFDLYLRWMNPDLWHPWKGGEKPMDFAYFNAILKSTSFPPYDPWYAGGYLNYYYYGFVFVGTLVKWIGIEPSIAYNLILPTIFSLIGLGAFSVVWNLVQKFQASDGSETSPRRFSAYLPALGGALGMALLGNLGTVRMIFQGYERLAAPGGTLEQGNLIQHWIWAVQGFVKALSGTQLPYGLGDWYWIPSRAIPPMGDVEPITEFPFFTVLYGDPHAHLFSLPITLLALTFALAIVLGRARWKHWSGGLAAFFLGGLAIGALRPTNTWDFPPYLALGVVAVGYALYNHYTPSENTLRRLPFLADMPLFSQKLLVAGVGVFSLLGLAFLLFQPYAQWYGLGYTKIGLWQGPKTPFGSYLTHWGLFLFLIVSWMTWETRDWMASTPASSLRKLEPVRSLIFGSLGLLVLAVVALTLDKIWVAFLALPLAAWAGVLLLRPQLSEAKRFVLFLIGTGLVLTLMVEVIVLKGDIGRMNTVFKFYLQVWTLFAVSAGAGLGWLLMALPGWLPRPRGLWQTSLILLVAAAALYPLMGGMAKARDRMVETAPHTLNGMTYMQYARYSDEWGEMDLSQDYRAIRWMQENVQGSPVIVEANLRNLYRWGSRFSIYTGLPGVVGWEWHQQQQRALLPGNWVSDRIAEIDQFYTTGDLETAAAFLRKYDVRYIIVGQQERGHYPGAGLDKFAAGEGTLWKQVYQDGDTVIYETITTNP